MLGKILKNNRGVTLLELMVAVAIFAVLILSATGIFKLVLDGQRNSLSAQNVQENMRYILEKMSKEIRMAALSNDDCLAGAANKIYNTAADGAELYFKNQSNTCVKYYLSGGRVKIQEGTGASAVDDFITPANLTVEDLKFYAVDNAIGAEQTVQPYATMLMDVKNPGLPEQEQNLKIQVSISSHYYRNVALAEPECAPDCAGKECGDDGCGGSCGSCGADESCVAGACQAVCTPACEGKNCGDDGCGGSCGTCSSPQICSSGTCTNPPPTCGDGSCNGAETCSNCPGDCGECPPVHYVVQSVNMTNNGSGYTSAPSVSFSGGGGSGAAATANLGNPSGGGGYYDSTIASISVSSKGSGYTSAPTVSVAGGAGLNATANLGDPVSTGGAITGSTKVSGGSGYTRIPTITLSGGGGTGSATAHWSGNPLVSISNSAYNFVSRNPSLWGVNAAPNTVDFYPNGGPPPTITCSSRRGPYVNGNNAITITNGGTGYQSRSPSLTISGGGGPTLYATLWANPATGAITNFVFYGGEGSSWGYYTSDPTVTISGGTGTGFAVSFNPTNDWVIFENFNVSYGGSFQGEQNGGVFYGGNNYGIGMPTWAPAEISSITVSGSGYSSAPTANFSGPGSGANFTIQTSPMTTTYSVSSVTVTNGGSGYTNGTAVSFTGGGGSGASATAYTTFNYLPTTYSVTGISVTNGGSNYTSTPAVIFSGGGGSGAAGTAVMQAQ